MIFRRSIEKYVVSTLTGSMFTRVEEIEKLSIRVFGSKKIEIGLVPEQ